MRHVTNILLILVWLIGELRATCPDAIFLGCVLRLKAQRAPFEKNMLSVVFNIGSEAKLLHTCKVYSDIMPCFRDKIAECGDDRQRRMLNEVGKLLMFLCSPFSLKRQRKLITHQKCIASILDLPATTGCQLDDYAPGIQVLKCREYCTSRPQDFICMMKTWISEQNVCTLKDVNEKCGAEAADFYSDLQSTVFEPQFPLICEAPDMPFAPATATGPTSGFIQTSPFPILTTTTDEIVHNRIDFAPSQPQRRNKTRTAQLSPVLPPSTRSPVRHSVPPSTSWTVKPAYYHSINIPEDLSTDRSVYRKPSGIYGACLFSRRKDLDPRIAVSQIAATSTPATRETRRFSITTTAPRNSTDTVLSLLKKFFPENFPISLSALISKKSTPTPPIAARETYGAEPVESNSWGALSSPSSDSQQATATTSDVTSSSSSTTTTLPIVTFTAAPKYAPGVTPSTASTRQTTTLILSPPTTTETTTEGPTTSKWKPWYLGGDVVMVGRKMEEPYRVG